MDKTMKKQSSLLLISSCLLQAVLFSGCSGTAHGFGAPAAGTGTPAKTDSFAWSVADNGGDFPAGRMLQGIEVQPKRDVLSPEARTMAAYLTMLQAVSTGHEEAGIAAAEELSNVTGENALPENLWLECALWYLDRKSVNAIPFLRYARKACPDSVPLLLAFTEALSEHNFSNEAMETLNAFLVKNPDNSAVIIQKGITQFKAKNTAEALKTFASVPKKDRSGLVEYYQAKALLALGRDDEALKHLRLAVKELPDFGEALSELAFVCEKHENYKEARHAYEQLLNMNYSGKDISLRLISLSLKMGQPEKAMEYFRNGPDDTYFKMTAASLFSESRHYLQAESILKDISSRPGAPDEVYLFLADLTYEQRHDLKAALRWLDNIKDTSGAAQRKFLLKAQLQAEAGRMEDAFATVKSGIAKYPNFPDFVSLEARLLARSGHLKEAIQTAREGVARWPDSTEMAFLLGNLYSDNGNRKEALEVMESILRKEPDNYQALNYVGYTLAEENRDIERAITLLTKANSLAPRQFYILDSLAWAHYRAGHLDQAWNFIREACQLDSSDDSTIWEHYGDIALAKNMKSEAKNGYKKALRGNPPNADEIRRKLEAIQAK